MFRTRSSEMGWSEKYRDANPQRLTNPGTTRRQQNILGHTMEFGEKDRGGNYRGDGVHDFERLVGPRLVSMHARDTSDGGVTRTVSGRTTMSLKPPSMKRFN